MVKLFCKISLCLLLILATLLFGGCRILDGGSLLKEDVVTVTPAPTAAPEPKGIGDTCTSDTWEIHLIDVKELDSVGAEPYDEKAAAGNKLLVLYFDVTNISEVSSYFNNVYFRASVDGASVIQKIVSTKNIEGREVAIGTVDAGETARYFISYEVPATWKVFEISYDIGGMNSNKLADFKFENKAE